MKSNRRRRLWRRSYSSGYAADLGSSSATGAVENPVPGVINLVTTSLSVNSQGQTTMTASRDGGDDGRLGVDYVIDPPLFGEASTGMLVWGDKETVDQSVLLTAIQVLTTTPFTITLSNARRIDGGTDQPTLGTDDGTGTVTAGAVGTIGLAAATYSADEGGIFTLSTTPRTGGTNGVVELDWEIEAGVNASPSSGTFEWAPGESAAQSVIIEIGAVSADTDVDITLSIGSGSPTLGLSAAVLSVTKKPTISVYESGIDFNTAWMADFGIVRDELVYMASNAVMMLGAPAAAGQTALSVTFTSGIYAGRYIGVLLDNGETHWARITAVNSSTLITITPALPSAAAAGRSIITPSVFPYNKLEDSEWGLEGVDTAHLTSMAAGLAAAGKTRAILNIEYVPGRPTSIVYNLRGSIGEGATAPTTRAEGIAALTAILNAFGAGFGSGEVSIYNIAESDGYIEYERQNQLGIAGDTYWAGRAAELRTYLQALNTDIAPLVALMDFYTMSQYGVWVELDPDWTGPDQNYGGATYVPDLGANEREVAELIHGEAITTAWEDALDAFGARLRVSWFTKTSAPNKDYNGVDIPGTSVRAPYYYLEWFFQELITRIPAGRREVNMWSGSPVSSGVAYWTSAEGATFLGYGGNLLPFHATHEGSYVLVTDDIEVNENGTFAVTVARVPAATSNSAQNVVVAMAAGATTVASQTIAFGDGVSGELSTANFTASLVSADTTTQFSIASPLSWQYDPYTRYGSLTVRQAAVAGTVALVTGATSGNELAARSITARRTIGADVDIRVPLEFSNPALITFASESEFIWPAGDYADKTIEIFAANVSGDQTITMNLGTPTLGTPTVDDTPVNFEIIDTGSGVNPGTINLTTSNISVAVGESFTLAFSRTGSPTYDGVVSGVARLSSNIANSNGFYAAYVQFADGSTTPTFPFGAPTFTATAAGVATITMDSPVGSEGLPVLAGIPKTLTVLIEKLITWEPSTVDDVTGLPIVVDHYVITCTGQADIEVAGNLTEYLIRLPAGEYTFTIRAVLADNTQGTPTEPLTVFFN